MLRWARFALIAAFVAAPAVAQSGGCALSAQDQAWVDRAMGAWNDTSKRITQLKMSGPIEAIFFDQRCVVRSATAMTGGPQRWTGTRHSGEVALPDGQKIPAGVISFAQGGDKASYFVMSTPSVWRVSAKSDAGLGSLELLMTAVVLHEASHVVQMATYGEQIGKLAEAAKLPEDLNDDSIQERFKGDKDFAESIGRETDLLLGAAFAPTREEAVRRAREARRLMKERHRRWFTGKDAALARIEDLFLSLEGSAQWAAYQWLVDPEGGGVDPRVAFGSFGWRGKWWSQNEGFALFMVLDRLAGPGWKREPFGGGNRTIFEMLDAAIATPR